MAEAASKEPSMEDILSSIRKIIAEEGGTESPETAKSDMPVEAPAMPDSVNQAQAVTQPPMAPEMAVPSEIMETPTYSDPVPVPPEASTTMVSEMPVDQGAPADAHDNTSLANIAASIQGVAQAAVADEIAATPVMPESAEQNFADTPASEEHSMHQEPVHVEMAEATPAPTIETVEPLEVSLSEEDMAKDEAAFRGALMSPSADNAVTDSFDRLKRSAMDDIEAKTEAVLRPMLREWLDENLPSLVEKLVREEIERVARG